MCRSSFLNLPCFCCTTTIAVHQLDRDLRREYEIALASAPELERKETNVRLFLISENHDPLRTATRLACYWKARRYIFGDREIAPKNSR